MGYFETVRQRRILAVISAFRTSLGSDIHFRHLLFICYSVVQTLSSPSPPLLFVVSQTVLPYLWASVAKWRWSILTSGTKVRGTAALVRRWTVCWVPHTAPTAVCTGPGPWRHWVRRREPRKSASTAMETGTSMGLCTPFLLTGSGPLTPCWRTWPVPYPTMSTCLRASGPYTPWMGQRKSPILNS